MGRRFLEQPVKGDSTLPPQGPWDSRQGCPGGFRANLLLLILLLASICPVVPSAHLPSSASFPTMQQTCFNVIVSPVEVLSYDLSGPSEKSRDVPRPWTPRKVFQTLHESTELCLPRARWVLGAFQLHRWAYLSLSFSRIPYPTPHVYILKLRYSSVKCTDLKCIDRWFLTNIYISV